MDRQRRGLDALPGPAAMPILGWRGNLVRFARDPVGYLDVLARFGKVAIFAQGMKGGIFRPSEDHVPASVFAYGPDHLGHCFNAAHAQFQSIHISPPPGRSYATLTWGVQRLHGDEHRKHRKLILPAFHGRRLDGYRDVLVAATTRTLQDWQEGALINVVAETKRLLLTFIHRAFLGLHDDDGALTIGEQLQDVWGSMMSIPVRIPIDVPLSPRHRAMARADRLLEALEALIAQKRAAMPKDGDDMLSMLLQAHDDEGAGLTKDELVGQLSFLIFAGFESTVHATSFAAYLLAQHPKVAAKLHDEVSSLLHGEAPTIEQLRALPYLDSVVKESLRLLSPVPFLLRTTEEPVILGSYELPPRTELMLSIHHTHRMPELFPDPNRFIPERWETINPGPYEYMPFSVGPHMCAGKALALMEMKVILCMVLQRFRLDLPPNAQIDRHMLATLGPRNGMWMRVQPQDRNFAESRAPHLRGHLAKMVEI